MPMLYYMGKYINLFSETKKSAETCEGSQVRQTSTGCEETMRALHAIVAFFTVVLLLIQQKYVSFCGGPNSSKQPAPTWARSSGDSSGAALPLLAADCVVCARAVVAAASHEEFRRPKYKRDPEIAVDNECIGYQPHEDD